MPGVTTKELNDKIDEFIRDNGAISAPLNYRGFPRETCISLNEVICHGIPDECVLVDGDILNIDVTTILNGFYGDTSRMFSVGTVSKTARKLMDCAEECLEIGIAEVRPGNHLGNIGYAIYNHAAKNGFTVVYQFCGHGVGLDFHEEPQVSHVANKDTGPIIQPGWVFTIEPMINEGFAEAVVDVHDKWTARTIDGKLSAQYEHTALVTDEGVDILTLLGD